MALSTGASASIPASGEAELTALRRRLFQTETLIEIGRECARVRTVGEVLHIILSMVMGSFTATRGIAFLGSAQGELDGVYASGLPLRSAASAEGLAQSYLLARGKGTALEAAGMEVCLSLALEGGVHGAIALGPKLDGAPYSAEDRALLQLIVDTASAHLQNVKLMDDLRRAADDLGRKVHALAVLNEIALGPASRQGGPRLQRFLVERVASALRADQAALAIQRDGAWTLAAAYAADGMASDATEEAAQLAARSAEDGGLPERRPRELYVRIAYGRETLATLWLRRAAEAVPFDEDDAELLQLLANESGVVLQNNLLFDRFLSQQQEQFRLRGILEQYLAPSVAERLISGQTRPVLEGTRLPITVLMIDMRGSTALINRIPPELMVRLLNDYLGRMTDILFRYEGTLDKFEGDAMLAFFGAPECHADDAVRAVRAAAEMQRVFAALRVEWVERHALDVSRLGVGIGIATGDVVVGNIGSGKRLEHTVIGPAVNLAARLTAKAPVGAINLDAATWRVVGPALGLSGRARGGTRVPALSSSTYRRAKYVRAKGFETPVAVYALREEDVPPA